MYIYIYILPLADSHEHSLRTRAHDMLKARALCNRLRSVASEPFEMAQFSLADVQRSTAKQAIGNRQQAIGNRPV